MKSEAIFAAALAFAAPAAAEPARVAPAPLVVAASGVGGVSEKTLFTRAALAAALAGLEVTKAAAASEGVDMPVLRARRDGRTVLEIFAGGNGRVGRVVARDRSVVTTDGVRIGMRFFDVYRRGAAHGCAPGVEEASGTVSCAAPRTPRVRLAFGGRWNGPDDRLPPRAVLDRWTVVAIVWSAR